MTSNHSAAVHFLGEIVSRAWSVRISAPPPGIEPSPASRKRIKVSVRDILLILANQSSSGGEKPWIWILIRKMFPTSVSLH